MPKQPRWQGREQTLILLITSLPLLVVVVLLVAVKLTVNFNHIVDRIENIDKAIRIEKFGKSTYLPDCKDAIKEAGIEWLRSSPEIWRLKIGKGSKWIYCSSIKEVLWQLDLLSNP